MKTILACLMVILASSCRQSGSASHAGSAAGVMTRHDEILRTMREADIRDLETNADWLGAEERGELRRLRKDFCAEVRDRDGHPTLLTLLTPGRGWVIRGPLTMAQVEQESLEELRKSPRKDIPPIPFGFCNDEWTKLKNKYQDGDEFHFYRSDERSWAYLCGRQGYVLIRGNEVVGRIVTFMN